MLTRFINISYFNYSSFLPVMLVPPCVRLRPVRSIKFSDHTELNSKSQEFRACVRPIRRDLIIQEASTPYRYVFTAFRIARMLSTRSRKASIGLVFFLEFEWIVLSSFTSLWASGIGDFDLFHMFLFWLARLSVFPMEQHAVVCKDLFPAMGLCRSLRDCEQPHLEFSKSFICFCRAFLFICAPHVLTSYDMYSLPA